MFFLKECIISISKSLIMCLSFIAFGMSGASVLAATLETALNIHTIETAVAASKTIGTLRKESPINADAIASAYTGALQTLVLEVDIANRLELNSDILAAIGEIKSGNDSKLAGQVIDKTLQRVFYQSIWNRITAIRDEFETATSATLIQMLDESVAAFQAITGTVSKTNQVLTADRQSIEEGNDPRLDIQIDESFARVRTALNKYKPIEDFATIAVERYVIRMSLARAYYNAVLREVAGVIKYRNTDPDETQIEQKEAEIYYRIIEPLIIRDNPAGNSTIKASLTGNASNILADEIVSELSKGLIPRVIGELNGQERTIGKDRAQAMAEASGAVSFAKILLPDLELRLGAGMRNDLEDALRNLQNASSENSVTKSADARRAILSILTSYEDELNLAKYSITTNTTFVDSAVSNYQAIGELLKHDPMDAKAIAAQYAGNLQQLTQLIDQAYGLFLDQDVMTAIEAIKNANQVALAAQTLDKTLQRVFALVIYNRITLVAENFDNLATDELMLEWDRAYAAYLAIIHTADKENKVLTKDRQTIQTGSNPDLDYQVTLAFVHGKQALNKANTGDGFNVAVARENIVIPLVRSFLIGVLREVEGIVSNRETDIDEAMEEQLEGEHFYRIVESFISHDNPLGSNRIKAQLTGDLAHVVANEIVGEISKGIVGQLNRSINQIEATFGVNKNQTILASERASLYANIFLPDLELRLDTVQRVRIENALRDLREACQTDNASKAAVSRSTITEIILTYEDELL